MVKKLLLGVGALALVVGGVAAMSAYEAHIINVTAHIENALYVHPDEIAFGTVFPQEYVEKRFTVELSKSFMDEDRVYDVDYVIKQKPKCICEVDPQTNPELCPEGEYAPVDYVTHECPEGYIEMLSLCPYLSKLDADPLDENDEGVPSYYVDEDPAGPSADDYCVPRTGDEMAKGRLDKTKDDILDEWTVDLKVPPVDGYVGQDWPTDCPVVEENDKDYGCDLWIEVTGISEE